MTQWPMVGRTREVEVLLAAYERSDGGAVAIVVAGEAGIGKTRLITEFANRIPAGCVVFGSCLELAGEPLLLAAVDDALRQVGEGHEGPSTRAGKAPDVGSPGPARRLEQFAFWAERIYESGPDEPRRALVVEDLHWADESTLDFLNYLIRAARRSRFLVVMTRRDDQALAPRASAILGEILRLPGVVSVALSRLTKDESAQLVESVAGSHAGEALPDRLYELAEGNPYLLSELAASGGGVPTHIRDVLLSRVQRLSRDARSLARLAAVVGRDAGDELLWGASSLDEDRYVAGIRNAVDSGVLQAESGRYSFRHSLTRDAILGELLPFELRRLHTLVASGLEKTAPSTDVVTSAAIAAHWNASGDRERTIVASHNAAERAYSVNAFPEAWRHFERVLELLDGAEGRLRRAAVVPAAAEAARWAGDISAGVRLLREALSCTEDLAEQAGLHERLGRYLWEAGSNDSYREYTIASEQLANLPPSPAQASVLAGQARVSALMARYVRAEDEAERALRAARRWHLTVEEASALNSLAIAQVGLGHGESALGHLREAMSLAQATGDFETICRTYGNLAFALEYVGDHSESCLVALEGLRALRERGLQFGIGATLANNAASILILRGRYSEGEALLRELLSGWSPQGQSLKLFAVLAELQLRLGHLRDARESLTRAAELMDANEPHTIVSLYKVEAELLLAEKHFDKAQEAVAGALRGLDEAEDDTLQAELCRLGLRIEADRRASLPALAPEAPVDVVDWLDGRLPAIDPHDSASNPGGLATKASVVTAKLEAARARRQDTWEVWHEAADLWSATDRPWDVAYCRLREAERAADGRLTRTAADALRASWAIASRLPAKALLDALRTLALRARLPLETDEQSSITPATVNTRFGLTPREVEVLQLLANGATNREIARTLFISDRTAAVHVSSLLRKLGVDNRVKAAGLANQVLAPEPLGQSQ